MVVGVKSVVFGFHNHEQTTKSRVQVKKEMKLALDAVSLYPEKTECIEFKKKCDDWLETALQTSQGVRDRLVDLESVIVYALSHPDKTAQQVYDACKVSLKVGSIRNMRRAAKRERSGRQPMLTSSSGTGATTCLATTEMTSSSSGRPRRSTTCQ